MWRRKMKKKHVFSVAPDISKNYDRSSLFHLAEIILLKSKWYINMIVELQLVSNLDQKQNYGLQKK